MIRHLIAALLLVCSISAYATTITLNPSQSTPTIQSLINGGVAGTDIILFSAGTYNLTAAIVLKCGLTYTGPTVPLNNRHNVTPTATINAAGAHTNPTTGAFTMFAGAGLAAPCAQATKIQYLNFSGGITHLFFQTTQQFLTIQFNTFTNIQGGNTGDCPSNCTDSMGRPIPPSVTQTAAMIFQSGTTTSNTASALRDTLIDSNQIGDTGSCNSPVSVISSLVLFNGQETYQGACIGALFNSSAFNVTFTNNHWLHVSEGVHINCPDYAHQMYPCEPPGGAITNNMVVKFNDFDQIHRINWEQQNQQALGEDYEWNTEHDWAIPYFGAFGLSMACCYNSVNNPGPLLKGSNNVLLFNVNAGSACGYGYGFEAGGWHASYDNNLIQATNSPCAGGPGMAWDCGNLQSMSNNTVQGGFGGAYIVSEGVFPCGSVTKPVQFNGNVTGPTVTTITSVAPSISPTPTGTYSVPITVTITDNGFTSGAQPLGNHSIFYTTDGSTPSTTSNKCSSPCVITVSPGATVNAFGMYGTGANLLVYPAGFGFKPSAVVSAHYSAGSSPTLLGVAVSLTGGGNTIQVGKSIQGIATCSYTGGVTTNCTTIDAFGTLANTWLSSNTTNATVTSSGAISGLVAGGSNITVKAGSFTSTAFPITLVAVAPTLTGINISCGTTVAIGQTTTCTAACAYTGPQQTNCTTTDTYGTVAFGWTSSVPAVATTSGPVVMGVTVGNTFITAQAGAFTSGSWGIAVTSNGPPPATLTGVTVACNPNSVIVGSTTACTATCTYSDSTVTNCTSTDAHGNDASFTSSVPSDATIVAATGVLTGVAVGSTNVSATAGAFTAPAFPVPVTAAPATNILGNNQFNAVGGTFANAINATYAVSGTNAGGYTVASCSFYLPTGTTYAVGSKWDCGIVLAPTPTTQASAWLCHSTYSTLGNTGDVGWHTLPITGCGTLTASTAYWISVITNETSPSNPGEGFWNCGSSCTGIAPTLGNGTYPCSFVSVSYGVYTGMKTAMTLGCGGPGLQGSQYVTLNAPDPVFVGASIAPAGFANTLVVGGSFQFNATCAYSDGSQWPCSGVASPFGDIVTAWTSSAPAVMTIGAIASAHPGLATGITPGVANVQATLTGGKLSSLWGVTINSAPPAFAPSSAKVFSR